MHNLLSHALIPRILSNCKDVENDYFMNEVKPKSFTSLQGNTLWTITLFYSLLTFYLYMYRHRYVIIISSNFWFNYYMNHFYHFDEPFLLFFITLTTILSGTINAFYFYSWLRHFCTMIHFCTVHYHILVIFFYHIILEATEGLNMRVHFHSTMHSVMQEMKTRTNEKHISSYSPSIESQKETAPITRGTLRSLNVRKAPQSIHTFPKFPPDITHS